MNRQIYFKSVGYFILSIICGIINDVLSKYICSNMHPLNVTFFRFAFSTLTLIPFICLKKPLKINELSIHIIRGSFLFVGIFCWIYGLKRVPLSIATVISFSIPLFTLIIGSFVLREKITWQRWSATILGLIGILITLEFNSLQFNYMALILMAAAVIFACLDVINKIIVSRESIINMMFYSSLVTAIISLPFAISFWTYPSYNDLILLLVIGISANLLLFFLLKAFKLYDATALAPYRYCELIITSLLGYLIFDEIIGCNLIIGIIFIIPATLFITYSEK